MSDTRDTRAIEPPTYRPGNPMWDAGWRACQAQAAELVRGCDGKFYDAAGDAQWMDAGSAILAMRPTPPTLPKPGEPRDYPIGHPVAGER
jgi:hypothetical protein